MNLKRFLVFILACNLVSASGFAQDTLSVLTYNVLHYGDHCQGSNMFLHSNLKTLVRYEKPDVLGMVKVQSIKLSTADLRGISPPGFADSILINAMNPAIANTYDYCPIVNFSDDVDGDMDLLFFNKKKLGFLSVTNLCSIEEDFNLYKLYYKDHNLDLTKDTTFLYFILNHTVSGTAEVSRDIQDSAIVKNLRKKFIHLPNLISMGDFNTHSSYEAGYQLLTATPDSSFIFSDPPFSPDHKISYPIDWETAAGLYAGYLNTSTRQSTLPNSCGTTGGAKDWYIHIFLSPWIVKNTNYIKYIPGSYTTIGNDGMRLGVSINDSSRTKNTSVPKEELNALYHLSDKYPIKIKLSVTSNSTGVSPNDPDIQTPTVTAIEPRVSSIITVSNPVERFIDINFPSIMIGQEAAFKWCDPLGKNILYTESTITSEHVTQSTPSVSGLYIFMVQTNGARYSFRIVKN
jgi:hypothetical protein